MKESNVQKAVQLAASTVGTTTWRNNTGAYRTEDGQFVRYGIPLTGPPVFVRREMKAPAAWAAQVFAGRSGRKPSPVDFAQAKAALRKLEVQQ